MNEQESKPVVPGSAEMLRHVLSLTTEKKQNVTVNRDALVDVLDRMDRMTEMLSRARIGLAAIGISAASASAMVEEVNIIFGFKEN